MNGQGGRRNLMKLADLRWQQDALDQASGRVAVGPEEGESADALKTGNRLDVF